MGFALQMDKVTVRFVGRLPSEEAVYFARRCAKERWLFGPLTVVIKMRNGHQGVEHEVRIEGPDGRGVSERGGDIFIAVRDAFDQFELA
jgi:hypothetical protein